MIQAWADYLDGLKGGAEVIPSAGLDTLEAADSPWAPNQTPLENCHA
jgi:hypothetical protein